uniref:procollagen-proline 4-dioxygenase n=1 Tax=Graphocephala atropunctata TaxID=36148 RepID=A0A1B6LB80_9HEMI
MKTITFLVTTSLILLIYLELVVMDHPHKVLTTLFGTEQRILNELQRYIKQQERHVQFLERRLREVSETVPRQLNKEQYLRHPVNNLVLIRRLVFEWPSVARIGANLWRSSPKIYWPGKKELRQCLRTLIRLQRTYKLKTKHLAQGLVKGDQADVNVTGIDLLLIAVDYSIIQDSKMAYEWLDEAIAKFDDSISSITLLELYVISSCFSGDSQGSVSALITLLEEAPLYEPSLFDLETWQIITGTDCPTHKKAMENYRWMLNGDKDKKVGKFNSMCRVATGSSLQPQHVLTCRYVHYNKTWLRLSPFRVEEFQLDPLVLLFHDFISDAEINEVHRRASPELETSEVLTDDGFSKPSKRRSSETAILISGESSVVDRITRRMADVTNLDTSTAEEAHVTRYGLGGENWPHVDFLDQHNILAGDRIATLMVYLSEVERGGHTVFQNWGLSVPPQKGAALFWFNLHRNGTGDSSTEHAGCPVLSGTKWVLNKWFHELNNDPTTYCVDDQKSTFKYFSS